MEHKIQLHKKLIYKGKIEILTGLRIGSNKDAVEIGGVDLPVVRRKDNSEPYIPGSSLKGKLRSLLDIAYGKDDTTSLTGEDHWIAQLFGCLKRKSREKGNPSRLIVRDLYLDEESRKLLKDSSFTDMPYTEIKMENTIDRIEGRALNPRSVERIPAGVSMDYEIIINIVTVDNEDPKTLETNFTRLLKEAVSLLNDDYLGGNGSRGYGQVRMVLNEPEIKEISQYLHGTV
jgi:CRISPR-associated protein Csm3